MNWSKTNVTIVAGSFIILLACLALIGKSFHIASFATHLPGVVSMKFNSAVFFLLSGIALLLLIYPRAHPVVIICAWAVLIGGTLTLAEYIFHKNFGIDDWLWKPDPVKTKDPFPARPSAVAAFNFILISITLLLIRKKRAQLFIWILLQLVFLISVLAFITYAFSIATPNSFASFTNLFLHTAAMFMVLCAAIFYSPPLNDLNISFQRKLVAGFVLILLILSIVFLIYKANGDNFTKTTESVAHTNEVLRQCEEGLSAMVTTESATSNYLLTGNERYARSYAEEKKRVFLHFYQLKKLIADNPVQRRTTDSLNKEINATILLLDKLVSLRKTTKTTAPGYTGNIITGSVGMDLIRSLFSSVQAEEKKLLAERTEVNKVNVNNAKRIFYFFGFVMPVILIILGIIIFRNSNAKNKAEEKAIGLAATLEKRVQERTDELLKSEHRFQQTLDNMMEGAQLIDFEWRYVYVNKALLANTGRTREQLIGHTMMENYPGIENTEMFQVYRQCLEDRVPVHMENKFKFPDGSDGWFELGFQPVPDGMFILSVDITDRKRSEEKVRGLNADIALREKKFRTIIESSNDIISLSDEKFIPFYRSPSAAKITGWQEDDRDEAGSVIDRTHPDDIEKFREDIQTSYQRPGEPVPVSFRTRSKTGGYIWLEGYITNLLHDEALGAIITNLQDVSLRKQSEEKLKKSEGIYRTIASGIPGSVICLFDMDQRYILIEGDMLKKLGYSKEALLGSRMADVLPPERYKVMEPLIQRVLGGETFAVEDEREGYDTISRFVPLKDEYDKVYAAMIVIFEVSELKEAQRAVAMLNQGLEEKVNQKTAQLQDSIKELQSTQQQLVQQAKLASLGELTAGIAHEIQNPLNFVNNFAELNTELLAEIKELITDKDPEIAEILGDINENSKKIRFHGSRADNIVKSMLQHSRRNTGTKESTDIGALADEYLRLSYHGLRAKDKSFNAKFEIDIDPAVGKVKVVPQDMGRVLLNLINNAFHAVTEKKRSLVGVEYEPAVWVSIKRIDTGHIEISIRDNGTGMPEKVKQKIFQPFFTTKPTGQGTGLGLSISNDIITQTHGGELKVITQEGEGTDFIILLPV